MWRGNERVGSPFYVAARPEAVPYPRGAIWRSRRSATLPPREARVGGDALRYYGIRFAPKRIGVRFGATKTDICPFWC